HRPPSVFDLACFYLILAILAARPMVPETFERVELSFLANTADLGPTPATTVWMDAILLVASALAIVRYGFGGARFRFAWMATGLLLLAVIISTAAAGEKRVAANAGAELCVFAIAGWALVRLMGQGWMSRILLAAAIASAGTNAIKCGLQRAYEFADTSE